MNREETHALFAQGKDAWNAWAEELLAKKAELEKAGEWDGAARVEFSSREEPHTFDNDVDFAGWKFPGDAWFGRVTFGGIARFGRVTFAGYAGFGGVTFGGIAWFDRVTFAGYAGFEGVTFGGDAWFDQVTFDGYTTFVKSKFERKASFAAIQVKRAFTLEDATFKKVPDFIQANFTEAPRFDNVSILPGFVEPGRFWPSVVKRLFGGDRDVPARWRALKRLAIQGHDLEREQLFFPMEIKSARFVTDWPIHWRMLVLDQRAWAGFFRFWSGVLYQIFSDFGRSILRPTVAFIAVALLSASAYLQISEQVGGRAETLFMGRLAATATQAFADPTTLRAAHPCAKVSGADLRSLEPELATRTDALSEAMHLSWSNGSIVGGLGGLDSARRTYGCLYGFVEDAGKNATPVLPPGVSVIATWQKTLSVIFIFLFGLALRNMLKMH